MGGGGWNSAYFLALHQTKQLPFHRTDWLRCQPEDQLLNFVVGCKTKILVAISARYQEKEDL
jgi:hypothetical protein